jgi:hypothetical protein
LGAALLIPLACVALAAAGYAAYGLVVARPDPPPAVQVTLLIVGSFALVALTALVVLAGLAWAGR